MGGGSKQSNDFLAAAVGMLSNEEPTDRATVSESAIYSLYTAYMQFIMQLIYSLYTAYNAAFWC